MFAILACAEECIGRAYASRVICIHSDSLTTLTLVASSATSKLDSQNQQIICIVSWKKRPIFSGSLPATGFWVMKGLMPWPEKDEVALTSVWNQGFQSCHVFVGSEL
jgi:hypothetical protein